MKFDNIIKSILKEELSREDKIKALKTLSNSKQYVVLRITGTYSHTPRVAIDSFGLKKTIKNLRVRDLKFEDYFDTHSLHEYREMVFIPLDLTREYYSKPEEVLKEWANRLPSEEGDQIYGIRNSSKDMFIAGIDYKDKDIGSELYIAFPMVWGELLETLLDSINRKYEEFISKLNDEADNTGIMTNCFKHLAEYFLNLPGNQRLN